MMSNATKFQFITDIQAFMMLYISSIFENTHNGAFNAVNSIENKIELRVQKISPPIQTGM